MAELHRVMKPDPNEPTVPKIGNAFACLGVRIPKDIEPDQNGNVEPSGKGLSISPSLLALGIFMVPRRYAHLLEGAIGDDKCKVWRFRGSAFRDGYLAPKLRVRCDSRSHAVVEPDGIMPIDTYQSAIAATQGQWTELEAT